MSEQEGYKVSCICFLSTSNWKELALSSFASQTYENKEMIIVSNSVEIEEQLPDNVKLLQLKAKTSIGDAKNKAIEVSTGQIIFNWEQGCQYNPNRIATQLAAMVENDSPVCLCSDMSYDINDRQGIFDNASGAILETIAFLKHPQMQYSNTSFGYGLNLLNIIGQLPGWRAISIPGHSICTRCC